MKITIFQSGKGDCLLLTSQDGKNILVDGGVSKAYRNHVRETIGKLNANDHPIDLIYVSHVDDDHIAGILQLMEDVIEWKRIPFQRATGNSSVKDPKFPKPPDTKAIWHNSFKSLTKDNKGAIEDQLVANTRIMNMDNNISDDMMEKVGEIASKYRDLTTSYKQGYTLTRRVVDQLKIPINPQTDGKLISVESMPDATVLGTMNIFVIGPFQEDLSKLRDEWNKWLKSNKKTIKEVNKEIEEDLEKFPVFSSMEGQWLSSIMSTLATALGSRDDVTPPNLASIMLLVEENGSKLLLTGDGHADDIIKGLMRHQKLNPLGRLHVDVLKVQHHGSKNNITKDFCEKITADHYIFCGNGDHHNPYIKVLELIVNTRQNLPVDHPQANLPYKMWFNSSSGVVNTELRRKHMEDVEKTIDNLAQNNNLIAFEFLTSGSKMEIEILP